MKQVLMKNSKDMMKKRSIGQTGVKGWWKMQDVYYRKNTINWIVGISYNYIYESSVQNIGIY